MLEPEDIKRDSAANGQNGGNGGQEPPEQPSREAEDYCQRLGQYAETGWVITDNGKHVIHCLTVIGQIEGHYLLPSNSKSTKYEHMIPQLIAVEENPKIEGLLILLNTVGGDIEAGLALAELIAGMRKPTVSLVLGGGHSIGVPLAVATKKSFIAPTATDPHPVRMTGVTRRTADFHISMDRRGLRFCCGEFQHERRALVELCMNTDELGWMSATC